MKSHSKGWVQKNKSKTLPELLKKIYMVNNQKIKIVVFVSDSTLFYVLLEYLEYRMDH